MMKAAFLSRFTPSLMKPEDLEAMFVQREGLVERLVETISDSALTPSKHHVLLVGPRGIGKTHLVALTYYRVLAAEKMRDRLLIAWLREEEWGVTSFLDLLIRIFRALLEEYSDEGLAERVESLYDLPSDTVEQMAAELLKEFVGDRTLLILMENLEDVFGGLGDEGQKRLRSYLQENPFCTILATAQSLFNGVSLQTSPFYSFFCVHHLEGLDIEGVTLLLAKIASLSDDKELASFMATPQGRARIRAVCHLAGNNHRVYVIFSQFLTRESLDELVESVMSMLDDMTPYHQARMMFLSPQQRKIVEFLIDRRSAVSVKEIAGRCFITHQTASSQLKALRDMKYVLPTSVGRESYYELREPLMRLCIEVKKQRGASMRLLVDFLRLWYSREELGHKLAFRNLDAVFKSEYSINALQVIDEEVEGPIVATCLKNFNAYVEAGEFVSALKTIEELVVIRGEARDWLLQGISLTKLNRWDEALASVDRALELEPDFAAARSVRVIVLSQVGRHDEMLMSFDAEIKLKPNDGMAWLGQGMALAGLERFDEALSSLNKAAGLNVNHELLWSHRGKVLNKLGRYDEALESSDKAIELGQIGAATWADRSMLLGILGRWDEALSSCDKAIEIDPRHARAWFSRGMALNQLGHSAQSSASFDRGLELMDTDSASDYAFEASILGILGRWSEASISYEKAMDLGMQTPDVIFGRVAALLALNSWDEGIVALDNALQRFAHVDEPDTGDMELIIMNLFKDTSQGMMWQRYITILTKIYDKHQALIALGEGLVRSIRALNSLMITDTTAQMWLDAWKAAAGDHDEFQIPLRLLDAAVRYRETHDQRVLLGLPIEERKLLESLLEEV